MEPTWEISQRDTIQLLQVGDLLSEFTNKEILKEIDTLLEKGFREFVIDLSAVKYINSVGLNLIIIIKERTTKKSGRVVLAEASDIVIKLLEMTKLFPLFEHAATIEEALTIFPSEKI